MYPLHERYTNCLWGTGKSDIILRVSVEVCNCLFSSYWETPGIVNKCIHCNTAFQSSVFAIADKHQDFKGKDRMTFPYEYLKKNRSQPGVKEHDCLALFKRLRLKDSLEAMATRYSQVPCLLVGCPNGGISWMKIWSIIWAENRCFQQRLQHQYVLYKLRENIKDQGCGISNAPFLMHQIKCWRIEDQILKNRNGKQISHLFTHTKI